MKKITRTTIKTFVKANQDSLYIKIKSDFNGMMVEIVRNAKFTRMKGTYTPTDIRLGFNIPFVGDGGDSFSVFGNEEYQGFEWYNCVGSGIIAIKKSQEVYNKINNDSEKIEKMKNLPKRLSLISAGKDINNVMELEPAIPIDSEDIEEIVTKIAEASEYIAPEDSFKPGTLVVLRKLFVENKQIFSEEALKCLKTQGVYQVEDTDEVEEASDAQEKPEKEVKGKKKATSKSTTTIISFMDRLFKEGKYDKKQILEKTVREFPERISALSHRIT